MEKLKPCPFCGIVPSGEPMNKPKKPTKRYTQTTIDGITITAESTTDKIYNQCWKEFEAYHQEVISKQIQDIDDLIKVQKDSLTDEYMRGLCNGLICAKACMTEEEPDYIDPPEKKEVISKLEEEIYLWVNVN